MVRRDRGQGAPWCDERRDRGPARTTGRIRPRNGRAVGDLLNGTSWDRARAQHAPDLDRGLVGLDTKSITAHRHERTDWDQD